LALAVYFGTVRPRHNEDALIARWVL
jgi:hypothetical protein